MTLIGRVIWGPDLVTAELYSDGTWKAHVDSRQLTTLAASLALQYADFGGPEDGPFGHRALYHLAKKTRGTLTLEETPPEDPYLVY